MAVNGGLADRLEIDSAGTIGNHAGSPPDYRMAKSLKARGYVVEGVARRVRAEDLEKFDLILAMDDENYDYLQSLARRVGHAEKIRKFVEFCSRHTTPVVPDPYSGGPEGFELVADILEDGGEGLLGHVRNQL